MHKFTETLNFVPQNSNKLRNHKQEIAPRSVSPGNPTAKHSAVVLSSRGQGN